MISKGHFLYFILNKLGDDMMKKKVRSYIFTLIGSIMILTIFTYAMHLFPFSDKVLFSGDLASQYIPFANFYKQLFHDSSQAIYSFMNGLGSNSLSLISYYLTSPFNLILLLFPTSQLTIGMMVIMYLKIIISSLTMSCYLGERKQLWGGWNAILSLSFAFCGFVTVYCYNILWLDVMIWLPLIVYGLELYIDYRKSTLFQWSLFLLFISNYYMAYMVSLFLAMYFVYWVVQYHFEEWKKYIGVFFGFVGRSLVLVMIAGFIYIPTIIGMLHTGKSSFNIKDFIDPLRQFGFFGLSGFGIGASQYEWRLEHVPTLYVGLLVLILSVAYFLNTRISKRERVINFSFITLLFLCLWLTPLTMVFQMFQPTAGFPFRFTYLISFMLIVFASEEIHHLQHQQRKMVYSSIIIILVFSFCLVIYYCNRANYKINPDNLWLSIFATVVFMIGMIVYMTAMKYWVKYLLFGLSILDLTSNFYAMSQNIGTVSQSAYSDYIYQYHKAIPKQTTVERLDNMDVDANDWGMDTVGYNDGPLLSFNGVNGYTSSMENTSLHVNYALGLYSWNERRISNIGETPLTQFILNVTKNISTNNRHFVVNDDEGKGALIPLKQSLPKMTTQLFENQNRISQSIWKQDVFSKVNTKLLSSTKNQMIWQLTVPKDGMLYVQIPRKISYDDEYQIFINGKRQRFGTEIKAKTLLPIKNMTTNEKLDVKIQTKKESLNDNFKWGLFDTNKFKTLRNQITTFALERKDLTLIGCVQSKKKENMLISIPYDSQWLATVNGKKVEIQKNSLSLMTIPVSKGTNHIRLCYRPTSLYVGIIVSVIGLLLECILIYRGRKNKK